MQTISRVKPSRTANWVRIVLETDEEIVLPAHEWFNTGLRVEDKIGQETLDELRNRSVEAQTRETALRLLNVRQRSREELRRRLDRKGFPAATVSKILDELVNRGYLCDARFARALIHDRLLSRQIGRRALLGELRQRGVGSEIAKAAIASVLEELPEGELALAKRAAARWVRTRGRRYTHVGKRRQALRAALARAGFDFDTIREALREAGLA